MQFGPPTTFYGEYRTYSATLVGLGLSGGFSGTLDFICNNKVIAQAPLQPLAGVQVCVRNHSHEACLPDVHA